MIQYLMAQGVFINDTEEAACLDGEAEYNIIGYWIPRRETIAMLHSPMGGNPESIQCIIEYGDGDLLIQTSQGSDHTGEYTIRPADGKDVVVEVYGLMHP